MNIWTLTDTHFGHMNMCDFENRPLNFSDKILKNTKTVVRPEDILIHLGDFCIGQDEKWHKEFFSRVKVTSWLVLGNHDKKSMTWYLSHGWGMVCSSVLLKLYGKKILLSHHREELLPEGVINVHGHSHSKGVSDETHIALAIEKMGYAPGTLRKILGA